MTVTKLYTNSDVDLFKSNLIKAASDAVMPDFPADDGSWSQYMKKGAKWFWQVGVNGNQMSATRQAIPDDSTLKKVLYSQTVANGILLMGVTSLLTKEILQYFGINNFLLSGAILAQQGLSVLSCICVGQNAIPKLWNNLKNVIKQPKEAALSSVLQIVNLGMQFQITKARLGYI